MKRVFDILKPTPLSLLLFLLLLLSQGVFFTTTGTTYRSNSPDERVVSFGIGAPLSYTIIEDVTTFRYNIPALIANPVLSWALAVLIARAYTWATGFRRPATSIAWISLGILVVSFLISIGFSRHYWGYWLFRPPVLAEINEVVSVTAVIPFRADPYDSLNTAPVTPDDYDLARAVERHTTARYYSLPERLLAPLSRRGLLPVTHSNAISELPQLAEAIRDSGLLVTPAPGYTHTTPYRGVMIDARNEKGERMVFLGLCGGEVSNDHRPYYELLYTAPPGSKKHAFVSGQRFFFDIAHIEGFEWYVVWSVLSLMGITTSLPIVCVGVLAQRRIEKHRGSEVPLAARCKSPAASISS